MNNKIVIVVVAIVLLVLVLIATGARRKRNQTQSPTTLPASSQSSLDAELEQLENSIEEIDLGDLDDPDFSGL